MSRLFIIRPFGVKTDGDGTEIDFDRVQAELIDPVAEALGLVTPTLGNAALRAALTDLRTAIETGKETPEALSESGCFEPVFIRIVEVGQASGELPSALETIGARLQSSASRLTDRLAAAAEPASILLLAGAIGFVVYATLAPMLQLTQAL